MAAPLLTICTAPKPFTDPHIRTIQRNALKSWKALGDRVEIVVLGADAGISENMRELDIRHIPDVAVNEKGTPLISSMLAITRELSCGPYLAIVNTDIILFDDSVNATVNAGKRFHKFLLIGQRWDLDITQEIAVDESSLQTLRENIPQTGTIHPPMGSDYFIFPRSCYHNIPDFAIGRAGWDNWFIYKSRLERWKVVDATADVRIIHQSHDYRHLPGGQPHYRLYETKVNVERAGGEQTIFHIFDAQFELIDGKFHRKELSIKKFLREFEISPISLLHSEFLGKLFYYLFRPKKAYGRLRKILKLNT
jgi:hypothetical protein